MSKVQVKLNYGGVRELLKSSEVKAMLADKGAAVLGRLPAGYEAEERTTDRAVYAIHAATAEARVENSRNNTLLKALG